ncbi:MAG TPA: sigma 54-interacting transcriptional regulator [Polyangiaceae bacterium]|nr:sigma 54-interacting transcriptional regulator [Polyangiaceae bacterium]
MTDPGEESELAALRSIVEGTATETGEGFFGALVEKLAAAMNTMGAWVAVWDDASATLRAIAMKMGDRRLDGLSYAVHGTPCQTVLEERRLLHIPERMVELYPNDPRMVQFGAVSYLGVPLFDVDQRIIGHVAVLDCKRMPEEPRNVALFRIFADRAAAELRRIDRERALRERENQLSRLLESAMDAILTLDESLRISFMNPAAERVFECDAATAVGKDFGELLAPESRRVLGGCTEELSERERPNPSLWVPGGLRAVTARGRTFLAEATLSRYSADRKHGFTLILRDLEERLGAERRIQSLLNEAEALRDELRSLGAFEPIVGSSRALLAALREVESVAATDTTVLLLGETGTGKELFAKAIHAHSRRSAARLVKVNCGAIPKDLVESELFGHEKGAFTGATARREGRFSMANGGTIFLDEIGELPVELQPKLLRVLQEGEFEPVGSSRTVKVDVRVVAATNRDLSDRVREGGFREDLYYRLNVFPIRIPPLRERGEDVVELARAFVERFCRRVGRAPLVLSDRVLERLRAHSWPGNVRELANVIERGVIVSTGGAFDVERALGETATAPAPQKAPTDEDRIYTAKELAALERENLLRALRAADWKISGDGGAGAMLGLNPSTLASRMRALKIRRPARR